MELLECRELFAVTYRLVDLGTLGGVKTVGYDINNANQVVGYSQLAGGADRAFLFKDTNSNGIADPGEMVNLGVLSGHASSYAYSINDNGTAVGTSVSNSAIKRAVRYQAGGGATDLNVGNGSNAYAINNANEIVGGTLFNAVSYLAFYRSAAGSVTNLGALGGGLYRSSEAFGINDSGTITGWTNAEGGDSAFVRPAGGSMTAVGFTGQPPGLFYGYAWDINAWGQVVGEGFNSSGAYHAFVYQDGVAQDLGVLEGFDNSMALAINAAGDVVGRLKPAAGPAHAFIYRGGTMQDLNDLIATGSGWVLNEARSINDNGYVVANATSPDGQSRAVLLVPQVVQEPPSVLSSSFQYLTAPHQLVFHFSKDVSASLSPSDLVLKKLTDGTTIDSGSIAVSYDSVSNTATFTFPGVPRMLLPDGRYRATLLASGVQDAAGTPLDGNGDGTAGDDAVLDLFYLTGDANHDATVDAADFERLFQNMGQSGDFSRGDYDYDGTVSFSDFQTLELMFGRSLAAIVAQSARVASVQPVSRTTRSPSRPLFAALPIRATALSKSRLSVRSRPALLL
jgi:probable HAF family extracellular repeat protein